MGIEVYGPVIRVALKEGVYQDVQSLFCI